MKIRGSSFIFFLMLLMFINVNAEVIHYKCGTPEVLEAYRQGIKFVRPSNGPNYIYTTHFIIHYDINNTTAAYAESVAKYAEYSWAKQVDTLNWAAPPPDGTNGGDSRYDIYVRNISYLGVTTTEALYQTPYPNGATSYIQIDNEISSYGLLQVTVAHEFNHACQFRYSYLENTFWYENTATWMEDICYDNVNDYVNYLLYSTPNPLDSTHLPITSNRNLYWYAGAIWAMFLQEYFNDSCPRFCWEKMGEISGENTLSGINYVLTNKFSSSLMFALKQYAIWRYFTGSRADAYHFSESNSWPTSALLRTHNTYPASGNQSPFAPSGPGGTNYIRFTSGSNALSVIFDGQDGYTWSAYLIGYRNPSQSIEQEFSLNSVNCDTLEMSWSGNSAIVLIPVVTQWSSSANNLIFTYNASQIIYKDVGVTAIEVPTGTIESTGTAIIPRARVKNFGTNTETFNVTFRIIGTTYNQTRSKTLGAGIEDTVNFPSWIPARGTFQARCSTYLAGDAVSNNNVLYNSFTVQVKDVGVTAIEVPTGTIDSTGAVIPRAKVKNFGSDSITFQVTFKIGGIYSSSRTKKLNAGIEDTVNFAPWSSPRGTYTVRCSTYVAGDVNHSNDTLSNSVTVLVNDVGVTAITSPPDTIYRGGLQPKATVKNYGTQPATFYTYFKILDLVGNQVYLDSSLVSNLNQNASSTRTFKAFLFQVGKYQLRCSTALTNDLNPINDVKLDSVVVLYIPAWVRKRDMPLGLSNKYVKAGGALTVGVGDKIYAFKGNNTNEFYVYDIAQDTWITLESIPYNPLYRKRVNRGAALAYNKHYNPDIIYAIKGNNTLEFWAYNVEQDTWIRKTDVPLSTTYKKLKNGSCITFLKRGSAHYVYLLKANNTLEFYAYHCDGDSWIKTLQPAPAGINLKAFKTGSCIVTGKDNKLYALKGGGKYNEFWCYDAASDIWTEKESLPRYDALLNKATKVKDGASLCFDGDSLIYAFKGGNRQSFWVYNINQNKWAEKETIPRGSLGKKVSSGGALAFADDKVFALKGNRTCEFWRFDPLLSLYNFQKMATSNLPTISQNLNNDNPVSLSKTAYSLTATKVQIYNSIGQLVYESEVLNDHSRITTKSLIPGVYFIKITDGKNNYSKKLIIK